MYLRERANQTYGVVPYFLSVLLVELPFEVINPIVFTCIAYFGVGLDQDVNKFFFFMAVTVLQTVAGSSFGMFFGCIFENPDVATNMAPILLIPLIFFGGLFTNVGDILIFLRWIPYISPVRYAFEALVRSEYEGSDINPNPIDTYNLDYGMTACIVGLVCITPSIYKLATSKT